jgi:DUF4097 and DUF4098 domain-containing protein YvlB
MAGWAGVVARPDKHDKKAAGPQIERVVAADPNVSISVCVASGDITVRGWERNQIRARTGDVSEIEFRKSGPSGSESAQEITVVASNNDRHQFGSCTADADIELDVPRGATVKIQIRDGDIQVAEVSVVQAKTMNGDISLEAIKRSTEADTLSGNVSLKDSIGPARLHSVGGNISAIGVGPGSAGEVFEASTVGGEVTLEKSRYAKVKANSIGGELNISGPLAAGGKYELRTISGDIHLTLPAGSSFRLDARLSQNADFTSDFPLKITPDKEQSNELPPQPPTPPRRRHETPGVPDLPNGLPYGLKHLNAIYGTGDAWLNISSFSGSVYLQKK